MIEKRPDSKNRNFQKPIPTPVLPGSGTKGASQTSK